MEAAIPKESMLPIEEWPDWHRPLAKNSAAILSPLHRPVERCSENERARRKVGTLCTVCMRVAEIREIGRIGRDCFRYTARTKRNDALRNICLFGATRHCPPIDDSSSLCGRLRPNDETKLWDTRTKSKVRWHEGRRFVRPTDTER